jgi:hypothetical protein
LPRNAMVDSLVAIERVYLLWKSLVLMIAKLELLKIKKRMFYLYTYKENYIPPGRSNFDPTAII